jgi:hypothetical protein
MAVKNRIELLPAALTALLTVAVLCVAELMPFGRAMLLVRVPSTGAEGAMIAAASAGAALVSVPSPGYAVVYGDAAKVRGALGLAIPWKGLASCFSPR